MRPGTRYLSRLIGIYCLFISVALSLHKSDTLAMMDALMHNAPVLLFIGVVTLAAGLAIVLSHNLWTGGVATVLVTLTGWISSLKGAVLLFLTPEAQLRYFEVLHYGQFFYLYMTIMFVLGVYLTLSGFAR